MKNLSPRSLALLAAFVLMVLPSSASATTLTGPSGEATPTIHAVNEGHVSQTRQSNCSHRMLLDNRRHRNVARGRDYSEGPS